MGVKGGREIGPLKSLLTSLDKPHNSDLRCVGTPPTFFSHVLPYFFAYKTVFFPFQNNPKNLDPSYKMDLDLWDCLGRVKPV